MLSTNKIIQTTDQSTDLVRSKLRTAEKVRALNVDDLDYSQALSDEQETKQNSLFNEERLESKIEDDDLIYVEALELLKKYAGIIFTGVPGTSKSWYAKQIAIKLTGGDPKRLRFVQFHASYQYEDFVEGFVPSADGKGFKPKNKHLLEMCNLARKTPNENYVLVIDELSRCDPARVFGEALTYIEKTKRGIKFSLASGHEADIPANLIILATMNPMDRGVDEVDAALERRFAKIPMNPNEKLLGDILRANDMDAPLAERVIRFFNNLQKNTNSYCKVGHAYFDLVKTEDDLRRLWKYQLSFHMEKAFRLNPAEYQLMENSWDKIIFDSARENKQPDAGLNPVIVDAEAAAA